VGGTGGFVGRVSSSSEFLISLIGFGFERMFGAYKLISCALSKDFEHKEHKGLAKITKNNFEFFVPQGGFALF
jgi:hypothetical protein